MLPGHVVADRFEIEREAGAGGMGVVYRARDRRAGGRPAAVKIMSRASLDARFAREAKILSTLRHAGIVSYIAHGVADGKHYLAMEWLDGETLSERLHRRPLSIDETIRLALRVTSALGAVHRAGVVHRDIKPSNLFLPGGDLDRVMLIDFGIASAEGAYGRITASGEMIGTPGYMAPEQAYGAHAVDARADVFSLGCVLFKCITGVPPFRGEHAMAILLKVILEAVPSVASLVPDVPPELDELIARMLEKDRERRPPDAKAVHEQLSFPGGGAPDAIAAGAAESVSALTASEQRVVCVVLARPPALPRRDAMATMREPCPDLAATRDLPASVPAWQEAVARHGGELFLLVNGALLVTLGGALDVASVAHAARLSAADHAAQMARCALALAPLLEGGSVVVAAGRVELERRSHATGNDPRVAPIGEVIERGVRLLAASTSPSEAPGGPAAPPARGPVVLLDRVAASLLEGQFDVRDERDRIELRGEHDDADRNRAVLGRVTPFVGRERELARLVALANACAAEPSSRAVLVTAPAGMGKSRLRRELIRVLRQREPGFGAEGAERRPGAPSVKQEVEVWLGRGSPLGGHFPSSTLAAAVREAVGPPRGGTSAVASAQAARGARLSILVLEDLHWGDTAALKLVGAALRRRVQRPLLVLALGRPEVVDLFPCLAAWPRLERMSLDPLPAAAAASLARTLLDARSPRDPRVAALVERAGGNPFYLEELARAAAQGTPDALPDSVLAVIEARLRAQSDATRLVLRAASVFGRAFRRAGVVALLCAPSSAPGEPTSRGTVRGMLSEVEIDAALAAARDAEIIDLRDAPGEIARDDYAFRSTMLRDAAYATLLDDDARAGHRHAAAWLRERGEATPATLAHHLERGGERERAAEHYGHAATQALAEFEWTMTLRFSERAEACGAQGEALGVLHTLKAEANFLRGDTPEARACALAATRMLPPGHSVWCRAASIALMTIGSAGAPPELTELISAVWDAPEAALADVAIALTDAMQLLHAVMRRDLLEAIFERLESIPEPEVQRAPKLGAAVHMARAERALLAGDALVAAEQAETSYHLFFEARDPFRAVLPALVRGVALTELGAYEEARDFLARALADVKTAASDFLNAVLNYVACASLTGLGRFDEAMAAGTEALEVSMLQGKHPMIGWSRIRLARLHLAQGDPAAALDEAAAASALVANMPPIRAVALAILAEANVERGAAAEALAAAHEAMAILRASGGVCEQESSIRLAYALSLLACGHDDAGRAAVAAARDRLLDRASRITDPALRQSFLERVPENARTFALARRLLAASAPDSAC